MLNGVQVPVAGSRYFSVVLPSSYELISFFSTITKLQLVQSNSGLYFQVLPQRNSLFILSHTLPLSASHLLFYFLYLAAFCCFDILSSPLYSLPPPLLSINQVDWFLCLLLSSGAAVVNNLNVACPLSLLTHTLTHGRVNSTIQSSCFSSSVISFWSYWLHH